MSSLRGQYLNEPQITFAPVNSKHSSREVRLRRATRSCDACRKRKLRCEAQAGRFGGLCARCSHEGLVCEFSPQKRRGKTPGGLSRGSSATIAIPTAQSSQVADVPGNIVSHTGDVGTQQFAVHPGEATASNIEDPQTHDSQHARRQARANVLDACIRNSSAAMDILTLVATNGDNAQETPGKVGPSTSPVDTDTTTAHTILEDSQPWGQWRVFWLIKSHILTPSDAVHLLDFYFSTLWPLKPIIPGYYAQRSRYHLLAEEEPILTATVILISSRYHSLPGLHGAIRSERIHWRSWPLVQKYLQSAMWGSACTRTIGTIISMLLLIEWHCKAINTPADITDDLEVSGHLAGTMTATQVCLRDIVGGKQRQEALKALERLNIVSPAYRSDKICWMMLGNAVTLAQEGCYFNNDITEYDSGQDRHRQEWNCTLLVFLHLTDEQTATRLGLDPLLPEKQKKFIHEHLYNTFAAALVDSELWERHLTLMNHVEKSRELLSKIRTVKSHLELSRDNLSALENIRCGLNRWDQQKERLEEDTSFPLQHICLRLDYYYARMSIFAPILHLLIHCNSGDTMVGPDVSVPGLVPFANESAAASLELLNIVVNVLHPSGQLKYLPVRFWPSIVTASLQLIKLTISNSKFLPVSAKSNILLLREVIQALMTAMPDDVHIGRRFSHFLTFVLNASLGSRDGSPEEGQSIDNLDPDHHWPSAHLPTLYLDEDDPFRSIGLDFADLIDFDPGGLLTGADFAPAISELPSNGGFHSAS